MKNQDLVKSVNMILDSYTNRKPFNGGCSYQIGDVYASIYYPKTEVESSIVSFIENNPENHGIFVEFYR